MPAGRPTKYEPFYCDIAEMILSQDSCMEILARELRISVDTIYEWKKNYPEFSEAIERGRSAGKALFMEKLEKVAWIPGHLVNNKMITLLAMNKYKMITGNTEDNSKVNHSGTLSVAQAVRLRDAAGRSTDSSDT